MDGAVRGESSTVWQRLTHSAALLGYGQLLSFTTVVLSMWLSTLKWAEGDRVPRLNNWVLARGILLPFAVFYSATTFFNIFQSNAHPNSGPRVVKVPLILSFVLVPSVYGACAALLSSGIDSRFYGLDLVCCVVFMLLFTVLDNKLRRKLIRARVSHDPADSAEEVQGGDVGTGQRVQNQKGIIFALHLLPLFAGIAIVVVYPFVLMPLFISSGVPTRVCVCLFIHPVLLEAAEALGRGSRAEETARDVRSGKITCDVAEQRIAQRSITTFFIKQAMAFYRRFMLLNMGSPDATLISTVVAAIEEALSRGFLVQIDNLIRSVRGLPELSGDDLRLQRLVWMCDTNHSCIAEFNAILTASFAHVLLQQHGVIFALGYDPVVGVRTAAVFVQLLVELTLELLVDNTAMWAESEHEIPVTRYFVHANGLAVFGQHVTTSCMTLCATLYAFIRHPHFSSCTSYDVCECLDSSALEAWIGNACAPAPKTNFSTSVTPITSDIFDDIDFVAVLVALLAGFAILVLIILAVLFARYGKRKKTVVALRVDVATAEKARQDAEAMNRELKWSLARAQRAVEEAVGESGEQLRQFCIRFAELEFIKEIGHGSYGIVWKGAYHDAPVAIKTLRVTKVTKRVIKQFMKEIKLMVPLRHDRLVRLIGGCWEDGPDNLCAVFEFCGRGCLTDLLRENNSAHCWETPYLAITLGVASCFRYLHHEQPSGEPIIHRDLKPGNIMICDDLSPRVGDFGGSTRFDQREVLRRIAGSEVDSVLSMSVVGTPLYIAPEIIRGDPYNKSVDVYSFGITLLQIACCDYDFVTDQFQGQARYAATTTGWRPKPNETLPESRPETWALIQACWDVNPKQRPDFTEIYSQIAQEPNHEFDIHHKATSPGRHL